MNLVSINDLTQQQLLHLFDLTNRLQLHNQIDLRNRNTDLLSGKTFILFFPESSIRTRITFEKGIRDLGGECILFPSESLDKRESLEDVIQYIQNWGDGVIVRHPDTSTIREIAKHARVPIINAMSSDHHPCEILSDLYSISQMKENYRELKYTYVGPASNICKSWASVSKVMDLDYHHVCAKEHELSADLRNYKFNTDLESTLVNSDVILTDSLPAELQTKEYIDQYQITTSRMELTRSDSLLNPCPPFFRNEEVSEEVISSDYFVGYGFKKNLIYLQQAVILYCCGIKIE